MAFVKKLAGAVGVIGLVFVCIFTGMYAGKLNTSTWFSFLGVTGTMAGLGAGVGMGLIECSIIALFVGEKGRKLLKNAQVSKKSGSGGVLALVVAMSKDRMLLVTVFILGAMPIAYWVVRPLYTFSKFQDSLPEYMLVAWRSSPDGEVVEGSPQAEGVSAEPEDESRDQAPPDDTADRVLEKDPRGPRQRRDFPVEPEVTQHPVDTSGPSRTPEAEPAQSKPTGPSHLPVRGKILPIDMKGHTVDPVYFDLSKEIRPRDPAEVGAIAALWCWEVEVGHYSGSNGAFQQHCTVMVWDKQTQSLLAKQSFVGGLPPKWSYHGSPESGSKPYAQIRDYLNSLPRR